MRAFDDVVHGFGAFGVAGQSALLAQRGEVLAAGDQLVHVGLVAGVEDHGVARGVEDAVDAQRQFDDAEVGPEVPAGPGHVRHQEFTDLLCEVLQLDHAQPAQVARLVDGLKQWHRKGPFDP